MKIPKIALERYKLTERRIAAVLLLLGALMRVWYMYDFSGAPTFFIPIGADVGEYYARAMELLAGRFFPYSPDIHAPVYSWFMAVFFRLFGFFIPLLRSFQLVLNFGAWYMLYRLLRRSGIPTAVRLTFLGAGMLLPVPMFYQAELVSESLLLPEAAAALWLIGFSEHAGTKIRRDAASLGAGAVIGLMNLTHPLTLLFSVFEVGYSTWRGEWRRSAFTAVGIGAVVAGFCVAAGLHYGEIRGIQANSAFNLYLGNNVSANGTCYIRPGMRWRNTHREASREASRRGSSVHALWLGRVADFWAEHPFRGAALWLKKACLVFSPSELVSGSDLPALLCFTTAVFWGRLLTPAVFLLAWFGLWRLLRGDRRGYEHFILLFFALWLAQIVTVTSGRYRLLMLTSIYLFAAYGICEFEWRRFWYLPLLTVFVCALFTVTDYGAMRSETASLYAEAAFRSGEFQLADEMAAYVEHNPDNPDPARMANLRGAAAEKLGDHKAAEAHYRRAAELDPKAPQAWMNLANITVDDPKRAEMLYRRALELSPRSPELLYNYALFRFRCGGPCDAEVTAALDADPAGCAVWNLAGSLAMRQRDFRRAAECFENAARFASDEMREAYLNNRRIALENLR